MRLAKFSFSSAQQYLLHDIQQARLRNGLRLLTLGIALLIGVWILYYLWFGITYPFPLIYDEGGQQVTTQFLLEGKNPFSLANQPMGLNNYGFLYSLTALPSCCCVRKYSACPPDRDRGVPSFMLRDRFLDYLQYQ